MTCGGLLAELRDLDERDRLRKLRGLTTDEKEELAYHWEAWGRDAQQPPKDDWRLWLIMAGRGFGKTRAGAEWVRNVAERDGSARIALVAASLVEARSVMVEGESGILAISPPGRAPTFEPSLRRLTWPDGAVATLYSAAEPESLRGPQHSHAWCDELGKWENANERAVRAWDNLQLGLRLGDKPRAAVTTTPRATALVRRLAEASDTALINGASEANAEHLPVGFLARMKREYGGTAWGRQELDGELLLDAENALWTRAMLEDCRDSGAFETARVVVGVDPPASARGDACGIVVCALGADGVARVLADCSLDKPSPERWARAVARAARAWNADRVVAEANQGGEMVSSVLRAAEINLPLRLVHARQGKAARAEPIAALYEAGRVRHAGAFPALEDQLCGLIAGGGYEGPGRSPDRADALVWALTELCLKRRVEPRVWRV